MPGLAHSVLHRTIILLSLPDSEPTPAEWNQQQDFAQSHAPKCDGIARARMAELVTAQSHLRVAWVSDRDVIKMFVRNIPNPTGDKDRLAVVRTLLEALAHVRLGSGLYGEFTAEIRKLRQAAASTLA